jgi:hypothetical protein
VALTETGYQSSIKQGNEQTTILFRVNCEYGYWRFLVWNQKAMSIFSTMQKTKVQCLVFISNVMNEAK